MKEKNVYTRRFTSTGHVEKGAGLIHSIIVSSNATDATVVTLYDGVDTSGGNMGIIRVTANNINQVIFPYGYKFNKGLYIVVGDNCEGVVLSIEKINL